MIRVLKTHFRNSKPSIRKTGYPKIWVVKRYRKLGSPENYRSCFGCIYDRTLHSNALSPESGHTYEAVLARMQFSWYRIIDLFISCIRDVSWIKRSLEYLQGLQNEVIGKVFSSFRNNCFGLAFVAWGFTKIFSIPYLS